MPQARLLDAAGQELPPEFAGLGSRVHRVRDPHPARASATSRTPRSPRDAAGSRCISIWPKTRSSAKFTLADFPQTGTRELTAEDYVYQIKRLAHPRLNSPIFGHMSEYIVGLKELADALKAENQRLEGHATQSASATRATLDRPARASSWRASRSSTATPTACASRASTRSSCTGSRCRSSRRCRAEADRFYSQRGMNDGRNLTLDWYPVGTGPYMLTENNPNARMVLERNPEFPRRDLSRRRANRATREAGLLADAGKIAAVRRPHRLHAARRKASPTGTSSCRATTTSRASARTTSTRRCASTLEGEASLTPEMEARGIRLRTSVGTSTFYLAFNFLDPVVGGDVRARAQAAPGDLDRGRLGGVHLDLRQRPRHPGHGADPAGHLRLPRGRGGRQSGRRTTGWTASRSASRIEAARKLLAEAGYPDGRDAKTGQPLVLYLDTIAARPGRQAAARLVPPAVRQARRSSSRSAPPTGTASRRRSARATRSSSSSAGTPTTRIPRTSCSC